jgi:hypothetical protein
MDTSLVNDDFPLTARLPDTSKFPFAERSLVDKSWTADLPDTTRVEFKEVAPLALKPLAETSLKMDRPVTLSVERKRDAPDTSSDPFADTSWTLKAPPAFRKPLQDTSVSVDCPVTASVDRKRVAPETSRMPLELSDTFPVLLSAMLVPPTLVKLIEDPLDKFNADKLVEVNETDIS